MDWKQATQNILDLESRLDVASVRLGGMAIWPLIRYYAFFDLAAGRFPSAPKKPLSAKKLEPLLREKQRALDWIHLTRPIAGGVLFFTRPEEFNQRLDGQLFNPYLDAIWDLAKSRVPCRRYEIDPGQSLPPDPGQRFAPSRYLPSRAFIREAIAGEGIDEFERKGFDGAQAALEAAMDRSFDHFPYENLVREFTGYLRFYLQLLPLAAPDWVVASNVCDLRAAALFAAARSLGIRSFEVQHGLMTGVAQGFYLPWPTLPDEGFAVLPDRFWTHDESSAEAIEAWEATHHHAVVGGNPYLDWIRETAPRSQGEVEALKETIPSGRKIVLVTLQSARISEAILEAMTATKDDAFFLVRLHPVFFALRQANRGVISAEEERLDEERRQFLPHATEGPISNAFFAEKGLTNVEWELASSLPLPFLLEHARLQVTHHSNTAFEAAAFDIPTLFLEKSGVEGFDDFVERGLFRTVETADAISACIRELGSRDSAAPSIPPSLTMQKDRATAESALDTLLSDS